MNESWVPSATYRLQFNRDFTFRDARELTEYLEALGITHLYASPILQSRRGSMHGYDVTDPARLNSELGSGEDFEALSNELRERGMGLLLDIVPNHMAADIENPWWADVLENGPGSGYASHFDINWHPPSRSLENKVLLPILGEPYGRVLESQQLMLLFDNGAFFICYGETRLPVAPKSYRQILEHRLGTLEQELGPDSAEFRDFSGILAAVSGLPERTALASEAIGRRRLQVEEIKQKLTQLYHDAPQVKEFLDENVRQFNGKRGRPQTFLLLDRLLSDQAYVVTFWRNANDEINYRRFFAVSELVGVRIEDPLVFDAMHALIFRLIANGQAQGLRIDHIDGLHDPLSYLRRVREKLQQANGTAPLDFYIVVEKILEEGESLPGDWPVCGTTGYNFLNAANGLFVYPAGAKALDRAYSRFLGERLVYCDIVYEKKKQVMNALLAVEVRALGHQLATVAHQDRYARELPRGELAQALIETTACMPVYRTYVRGYEMAPGERRYIEQALAQARRRNPRIDSACFDFVADVLLLRGHSNLFPEQRQARLDFVVRWQQFTGPVMAKGFEDTVLYVYNRLVSLDEVGGDPHSGGISAESLHEFIQGRARRWSYSMNASTTHDTKRAEDVRARVNVLSEIPEPWERKLRQWARWNRPRKSLVNGQLVPYPNEEFFLYETLIGAWPLDPADVPEFRKRLKDYAIKATREAMVHTRWTVPNVRHERALLRFLDAITKPGRGNQFLGDFLRFHERVAHYGFINSLAQLLVKIAAPGVPDFYQGSELWDFRLVDPDNRRPVDFNRRRQLLAELRGAEARGARSLAREFTATWKDGRIKMYVIAKALAVRKRLRDVFRDGAYTPLEISGLRTGNVFAFARVRRNRWIVAAVPRFMASSRASDSPGFWDSSRLVLPAKAPARWTHAFTGETLCAAKARGGAALPVRELFADFPIALLEGSSGK